MELNCKADLLIPSVAMLNDVHQVLKKSSCVCPEQEAPESRIMNQDAVAAKCSQEKTKENQEISLLSFKDADEQSFRDKNAPFVGETLNEANFQGKPAVMIAESMPEGPSPSESRKDGEPRNYQETIATSSSKQDASLEARNQKSSEHSKRNLPVTDDAKAAREIKSESLNMRSRPLEDQSLLADTGARKRMRLDNRVQNVPGFLQNGMQNSTQATKDKHGAIDWRPRPSERKKGSVVCQKELSVHLGENEDGLPIKLEVINESNGARLSLSKGKDPVWKASVKGAVINAGGNLNFVAVSTNEGFILVSACISAWLTPATPLGLGSIIPHIWCFLA